MAGSFLGGLTGGAIGSAVVRLVLDADQYQAQLATAKGQTATATTTMGASASKMGMVAGAAFAALGVAAVQFGRDALNAAVEAEASQAKLANSVKNSASVSEDAIPVFNAQAESIRQLTGADDEAITSSQALLVQMGLTTDQVSKLTPLIVDLSAKMGVDLETAAKAVGKAVQGNTGALARYIGTIEKGTTSGETFRAVLDKLGASAGFAAERAKNEPWRLLQSNFDELQETVGKELLPVVQELVPIVGDLAEAIGPLLSEAVATAADSLGPLIENLTVLARLIPETGDASEDAANKTSLWDTAIGAMTTNGPLKWMADYNNWVFRTVGITEDAGEATGAYAEWIDSMRGTIEETLSPLDTYGAGIAQLADWEKEATQATQEHTDAIREQRSAELEAVGGLLGLYEASRSYQDALKELNKLRAEGKQGTQEYRDAIADVANQYIDLQAAALDYGQQLKDQKVSVDEAKASLRDYGRDAGLTGADLRDFISTGLRPVKDELQEIKRWQDQVKGNNITFSVNMDTSQLEAKMRGLESRYGELIW